MKKLIFGFLIIASLGCAQGVGNQELKDAYVECTLELRNVKNENIRLNRILEQVKNDLIRIETKDQLDSLKTAYGLKGVK